MVVATSTVELAISVTAIAAGSVFVSTIAQHRHDPTARPLIGVAVVLLVGAVTHFVFVDFDPGRAWLGIDASPEALSGGLWLLLAFDITALVSVSWFLFALQYTGRDDRTAFVAWIAVATVLVLLVGPHFQLRVAESVVGFNTQMSNVVLGVAVVLAAALALIGLFLVLDATFQHKAFQISQTAVHASAVGTVLLVPFVATTVRQPFTTPLSIATSSLLFTGLVSRYRLFETLPVASVVGRDRVIEEMSDGVLIVGADHRIRDLNPEAEDMFDVDRTTAIGRPLNTAIPAAPTLSTTSGTDKTDVTLESGRTVSIRIDKTTDRAERPLGWLLFCRDITEQRQQARRLSVLNRVVAGVTTDQMRSVTDVTAAIKSGKCEPTQGGNRIRETATAVAVLVDNVRDIENTLSIRAQPQNSSADFEEIVGSLSMSDDTDVGLESYAGPLSVSVDAELLAATLDTLLAMADSATLQIDTAPDSIIVVIKPFDVSEPDSLKSLTLRVAEIVAESASWELDTAPDSTPPAVRLSLPVMPEETRSNSGGQT